MCSLISPLKFYKNIPFNSYSYVKITLDGVVLLLLRFLSRCVSAIKEDTQRITKLKIIQ